MAASTLVLAHGAGAGQAHPWMRHVADGLRIRGVRVVTFDFPYMAAGRRLPDKAPVLEAAFGEAWESAVRGTTGPLFAGGKSMGGRMASMVAARGGFTPPPAGLVLFGYPLHPPGRPDKRRDAHLPAVACPILFAHGTKDPFGTPDEMHGLASGLPRANLQLVDGGDHSLVTRRGHPVADGILDDVVAWMMAATP
jgi:predicted alpha/beta-hydrolase family hydrolase